jgi:aldehyde:ferredoxin oxidoreductase
VNWQEKMHYIDDSIGMCAGLSSFPLKPPFHIHNLPMLISAGVGFDLDESSLTHLTRRNRDLVRANNIRRGMRREDERPPEDHWKKRFPELERGSSTGATVQDGIARIPTQPPGSAWATWPKTLPRQGILTDAPRADRPGSL